MLQVSVCLIQQLKKDFVALKAEVNKLDINKLINVPTSLNNLKIKVHDLDVSKLKTVPGLKRLNDLVDNRVVKNTKFNTLKTKVNKSDKKILDVTTLSINTLQINKIQKK